MLGWLAVERIRDGKATTLGAASGAVAGLVAITPACAYVSPIGSIILGVVAGALCCSCTPLKFKLGFDDSLDVVAVHLIGGITGALALGFLSDSVYGGANGLFYGGGWHQLRRPGRGGGRGRRLQLHRELRPREAHQPVPAEPDERRGTGPWGWISPQHGEAAYEFDSISAGSFSGSHAGTVTLERPTEVQA